MDCPNCGGPVYDNRQQNETRRAEGKKPMPEFKCKDADCAWVKWPPREPKGPSKAGPNSGPPGPKWTWGQINAWYGTSLRVAVKHVRENVPEAKPEDVVAAAATIFIGVMRDSHGIKVAPKPEPKPEPKKPVAEREAIADEHDDYPEDDDLPF